MSYSEENGQVVLRMSREDYDRLLETIRRGEAKEAHDENTQLNVYRLAFEAHERRTTMREFSDRLNSGNPNYTPYQVEEKKSI